jgi:hypothetical protein
MLEKKEFYNGTADVLSSKKSVQRDHEAVSGGCWITSFSSNVRDVRLLLSACPGHALWGTLGGFATRSRLICRLRVLLYECTNGTGKPWDDFWFTGVALLDRQENRRWVMEKKPPWKKPVFVFLGGIVLAGVSVVPASGQEAQAQTARYSFVIPEYYNPSNSYRSTSRPSLSQASKSRRSLSRPSGSRPSLSVPSRSRPSLSRRSLSKTWL